MRTGQPGLPRVRSPGLPGAWTNFVQNFRKRCNFVANLKSRWWMKKKKKSGGCVWNDQCGDATKRGNFIPLSALVVPNVLFLPNLRLFVRQSLVQDSYFCWLVVHTEHTWEALKLRKTSPIYRAITKYKKSVYKTGKFHGPSLKQRPGGRTATFPYTSITPKVKVFINVLLAAILFLHFLRYRITPSQGHP